MQTPRKGTFVTVSLLLQTFPFVQVCIHICTKGKNGGLQADLMRSGGREPPVQKQFELTVGAVVRAHIPLFNDPTRMTPIRYIIMETLLIILI